MISSVVRVAAAALLLVALAVAPAVRADSPPERVGVLLADHGEPPEYNAWTYESFREFFQHLIAMGVIPRWLTALETGTILYDADCPGCPSPSDSPRLVDAWLRPHDGPAVFVPASDSLPAHYVEAGGPGFREPDIYEHVGLSAWHEWQRMGGRSPNYDEKLVKKRAVIDRLRAAYGDDVAIRVGYGIDPRIGGGRQGIREAVDALVNRDRVDSLVVVYHGVGFSDIMQTHHLRHQIADHLAAIGAGEMPVRYAAPLGTTAHYVTAVVEKVRAELALLPPDAAVAIHLSGHGLSTTTCGEYDCGADAYHRYAADLFARTKPAIEAALAGRRGRTGVFHVYGDGSEGDADPDNEVASPIEALDARVREGWTHVVDIPYEFDSNSRDTLIVLRQSYGRPQPDWNAAWESHFAHGPLHVKIANVNGGEGHKTAALEAVTLAALDAGPGAAGGHDHGAQGGAPAPRTLAAAPPTTAAAHTHTETSGPAAAAHLPAVSHFSSPRGPKTETSTEEFHKGENGVHAPSDSDRGEAEAVAAPVVSSHHGSGGGSGGGGGTSRTTGVVLVVLGAAALAAALAMWHRPAAGRLAVAGVGAQLVGLGWDVLLHAGDGQAVDLLENSGHRLAFVGLVATAVAAGLLLRSATPAPASDAPPAPSR